MRFMVNGESVEFDDSPGEMLSDLLRYRLGLTGTKVGCNEAECGSCTVLVNGDPILACSYPAARAEGSEIRTVEGLAKDGNLHPIQRAFIRQGAVQCGFCIPGQIMTSVALLEKNPDPTEADIKDALKDTLCRCAGYPSIIAAIQEGARDLRSGDVSTDLPVDEKTGTLAIGKVLPRPDSREKVTGEALFTDDYTFPDMLVGRTLRAGVPHAIIKAIDVSAARELSGVVAVLTAEDVPGEHHHGLVIKDWPVLIGVGERVRYVGDAVVIVAAEDDETAWEALNLIDVTYEHLPIVSDPVQARLPETPQLHEGGNLLKHIKVRKGDIESGFEGSELILEDEYQTPFTEHAFMEPECSIAHITEDGRIEVIVGSQIPYADREQIAACLGIPDEDVRIKGALIGGGFGGKEDIAGQIHAAMLAQATGRPVKILYDRHESFIMHPKRHATQIQVRMGADRGGKLLAVETELYGDTGAYASLGEKVMTRATTHSAGPYNIPDVKADCYAMYTNNSPAGAFRGFGVTQSCFAIESMMDLLAEKVGMDPFQIRRLNALQVGHITNTGQRLTESVGLLDCLDQTELVIKDLCPERDPFQPHHKVEGDRLAQAWGIAAAYKNTGLGGGAPDKAAAEVEIFDDGTAQVRSSSADMGQGLVTVLQLITAEELGLPPEHVHVLLSDTDLTPDGGPTTASRQTYVTGNAVKHAAEVLRQAMTATLSERFDAPPDKIHFIEGLAQVNGTKLSFGEAVKLMKSEGKEPLAKYEYWAPETQPLGTGGDMHFAYSFAVQAAEVEVDLDTGEVRVLRVIAANDVGRALNPLGLKGQIEGGVMMGLGNALTEEFILEEGQVFTDRMARYRMPSIVHTPEIHPIVVEHPTREGPFGAKGVGEVSSIPTTPAITNAIYNACGVRVRKLPVDQDWLALELAKLR